jgi:hypothetical protein
VCVKQFLSIVTLSAVEILNYFITNENKSYCITVFKVLLLDASNLDLIRQAKRRWECIEINE